MQKFELVLKNEKQKFYDRFAILIMMLNGCGLTAAILYSDHGIFNKTGPVLFLALAFVVVAYPLTLLIKKKVTSHLKRFLFTSFPIVLYWILIGYWWVGVVTSFLLLCYVIAKRDLKLAIGEEQILFPSFPVRVIKWEDLNNLILKDRLLTIDLKNNKLIQQLIDERSYSINEREFNDFCRQQLNVKKVH